MKKLFRIFMLALAFAAGWLLDSPIGTSQSFPPPGGQATSGSFSGANTGGQAITLPAVQGKLNYVCGFSVSGLGSTGGGAVSVTVATLQAGQTHTFQYVYGAGAAVINTPLVQNYGTCIPAQSYNSAITLTVPGQAGNTATNIVIWGYVQ